MQMTESQIKRNNVDLNKLITGMGLLWTLFLQTFQMKKSTAFHRYDDTNIAGSYFATLSERQQKV